MDCVKVRFSHDEVSFEAFQEVEQGVVVRYCDEHGETMFIDPPECSAEVVDATPVRLAWMQ